MAWVQVLLTAISIVAGFVAWNVISQTLLANKEQPPVAFHWLPFIGSTVAYGKDPYAFFFSCRKQVSV